MCISFRRQSGKMGEDRGRHISLINLLYWILSGKLFHEREGSCKGRRYLQILRARVFSKRHELSRTTHDALTTHDARRTAHDARPTTHPTTPISQSLWPKRQSWLNLGRPTLEFGWSYEQFEIWPRPYIRKHSETKFSSVYILSKEILLKLDQG